MTPSIKGLPEGVEFLELGVAGDNDFELVGDLIFKGRRPNAASGVLVKPADGYTFQPSMKADIRNFVLVRGPENSFMPVKQMAQALTVEATATFAFTNESDKDIAMAAIAELKGLPGFVGIKVQ